MQSSEQIVKQFKSYWKGESFVNQIFSWWKGLYFFMTGKGLNARKSHAKIHSFRLSSSEVVIRCDQQINRCTHRKTGHKQYAPQLHSGCIKKLYCSCDNQNKKEMDVRLNDELKLWISGRCNVHRGSCGKGCTWKKMCCLPQVSWIETWLMGTL